MQKIRFEKGFEPKATLECGQLFRYEATDSGYRVFATDKTCEISSDDGGWFMLTDDETFFKNYFDFNRNYDTIINNVKADDKLRKAAEFGKGIRILNQDPVETVFSFIVSANNNIPRIKLILNRLCRLAGECKGDYYAFPTLEAMASLDEKDFSAIGAGYRASYLASTAKSLLCIDFDELRKLDTGTLRNELMKLKGVGRKVADCILLFGFHRTDVFPVDTWIKKVFQKSYGDLSAEKLSERLVETYGELSGYVQQYLFYYARDNFLEEL